MAIYNPFECCQFCVPPKRYPGCSARCPEYSEAKIMHIARTAIENKDREAREYTKYIVSKNVNNSAKRKKEWQSYRRRSNNN